MRNQNDYKSHRDPMQRTCRKLSRWSIFRSLHYHCPNSLGDQNQLQKQGQIKMTTEQPQHTVQIPGQLFVTFGDEVGDIRFTFSPSASYAGYFGDDFFVIESNVTPLPDVAQLEGQLWEQVRTKLMSDHTGQQSHFVCSWEE